MKRIGIARLERTLRNDSGVRLMTPGEGVMKCKSLQQVVTELEIRFGVTGLKTSVARNC